MARPLTPAERSARGRIGGYRLRAERDPLEYTAKARQTFLESFAANLPADLSPAERERRKTAAIRAHMAGLSYRAARARSRSTPSAA